MGAILTLSSPLIKLNSLAVTGTVILTTGSLVPTSNPNVLGFTGGSMTVTSGGSVLYQSSFSSGTLVFLGATNFSIRGSLKNGTALITEKNGDVRGGTLITAEPGTVGLILMGIGLTGLAGVAARKERRSDSG